MTDSQQHPESSISLGSALLKALLLAAVIISAIFAVQATPLRDFVDRETLTHQLDELRETAWAAPLLVILFVVMAPLGVPISPLILAGGAVFGLATGWLLNFIGALTGAVISFLIGQKMGRDLVVHLMSAERLRRAEEILQNHGFWAIVRIRLLPIPFAIINYGAALAGVRFSSFLVATILGLAPAVVIYTTLSHALVTATGDDRIGIVVLGAMVIGAVLTLTFAPALLKAVRRGNSDN